jgi:PIN domain nuclease of toxin-antitoxin system
VRLLLDTHALLWWLDGDRRLSGRARRAIGDESNHVFVSAASAWELSTKARLGKLPAAGAVAADVAACIADQGFQGLDVTVLHGQRAGELAGPHRDPFDRLLAAQALTEGLTVVSADEVFDAYSVRRFW